jgi:hypothetical protein
MSKMSELDAEANDAFYVWEQSLGRTDLSDRDRCIWCEGYVEAKLLQLAVDKYNGKIN